MDVFVKADFDFLDNYIKEVMKKYDLRSDPQDVKEMIIESLKEQAIKIRKGNEMVVPTGVNEEALRNAIIKCSSHVKAWKEQKAKKKDNSKPTNVTIGDNYYDKNGQKHTKKKAEPKKEVKKEKKGDTFDLTQLELFDFE